MVVKETRHARAKETDVGPIPTPALTGSGARGLFKRTSQAAVEKPTAGHPQGAGAILMVWIKNKNSG